MRSCGTVPVPVLTGIILLLLLNFGKIVQGHCWEKKFYYKHPHSNVCGICRICPPEITKDPEKLRIHQKEACKDYTLPDGRLVQCHSTNFAKPSCVEWEPDIGTAECNMDNTVYSSCRLECPPGYKLSHSFNITCESHLQWDRRFPKCVAEKPQVFSHHRKLHVGAIIGIVLVSMAVCPTLIGVIVFRIRRRTQTRSDHDPEEGIQASKSSGQVIISLTNAEKRINKKKKPKWIVKRGSTVTVSAENQSVAVQYLVFVKTGSKLGREMGPVYTSKPGGPTQIELDSIHTSHHGYYSWIVGLSDGTKEKGTFKIAIEEPAMMFKDLDSRFCENHCENNSMNDVTEQEGLTNTEQADPSKDTAILISTATEDEELSHEAICIKAMPCDSGFKRLMRNRQDVHTLYTLLDREEKQDEISWHVIAMSDLLCYDTDTVTFLEYHLKGKLYKGPMSYILTLMRQQGTTVAEFVEFLKKYEPSSNRAISILEKYL